MSDLILRTVYLPRDLDDRLRRMAFHVGKTGGSDLIRAAVELAVNEWEKQEGIYRRAREEEQRNPYWPGHSHGDDH